MQVDWYGLPFEGGDSLSSAIQGRNIAEQSSRSPNASPSRSRNRRRGGSRTNDDGDNDDDDNGSNSSSSSSSSSSREAWPGFVALIVAMDQWLWAAWADGGTTVALVALAVVSEFRVSGYFNCCFNRALKRLMWGSKDERRILKNRDWEIWERLGTKLK